MDVLKQRIQLSKIPNRGDTMKLDMNDEIVRSILVTYDGKIVHAGTKEAMGIA